MIPAVSVLMPVRNAAGTVRRAVDSILAQTMKDFELLILDDASHDGTGEHLAAAKVADSRIELHRSETHVGLVEGLNLLAARARAPLLARMDADDFSHPDRFLQQVEALSSSGAPSACGTHVRIVGGGEGMEHYEAWLNALAVPADLARERFIECPIAHPTLMLRRDAFLEVGGYRAMGWAEDYDLVLRLLAAGHQISNVPRVLFDWHDSPDRTSRTDAIYAEPAFLRAKAHFLARLPEVRTRGVAISGCGPTGKRLARLLMDEVIAVHAFYEVGERKIGGRVAGAPVLDARGVPTAGNDQPVQLSAVAIRGKRGEVRTLMAARGWTEGHDFFCAA